MQGGRYAIGVFAIFEEDGHFVVFHLIGHLVDAHLGVGGGDLHHQILPAGALLHDGRHPTGSQHHLVGASCLDRNGVEIVA